MGLVGASEITMLVEEALKLEFRYPQPTSMPGEHDKVFVISVSESDMGIPCVFYQSSAID